MANDPRPLLYLPEPFRSLVVWVVVVPPAAAFIAFMDPLFASFAGVVQPTLAGMAGDHDGLVATKILFLVIVTAPYILFWRWLRLALGEPRGPT